MIGPPGKAKGKGEGALLSRTSVSRDDGAPMYNGGRVGLIFRARVVAAMRGAGCRGELLASCLL